MPLSLLLWLNVAHPETSIQVDLSALFTEKTDTTAQIQHDDFVEIYPAVARVLHDAGVPIVDPSADLEDDLLRRADIPTVSASASASTIRLEFSSPEFVKGIYRIHVSVLRSDGSERALPPLTCGPNCLADHVETFLRANQAPILELLEPPLDEDPPESCPGAPHCTKIADHSTREPSPASKLGPLGIVGAVGMGIGAGFLTWSGVSLGLDRRAEWDQNRSQDRQAHFANTGTYAVLGVGGVLVASGIVMVVVDRVVLPKRRHRERRTTFEARGVTIRF